MISGGWFTCGMEGVFFAIISNSKIVNFIEVMLYSNEALQMQAYQVFITSEKVPFVASNARLSNYQFDSFSCIASGPPM